LTASDRAARHLGENEPVIRLRFFVFFSAIALMAYIWLTRLETGQFPDGVGTGSVIACGAVIVITAINLWLGRPGRKNHDRPQKQPPE